MKSICVFCGSSLPEEPAYIGAAAKLGKLLAEKGIQLVYGGADVGLMGVTANACLENGGTVVGIMPKHLVEMEVAHQGLSELLVVESMHERKALMNELSEGFISLAGGIGTLEETFEMFTWLQLGLHAKPLGLLNTRGFYDHLTRFLGHMVDEGFLMSLHSEMLMIETDPAPLLDRFEAYEPVIRSKWFDKEQHRASGS